MLILCECQLELHYCSKQINVDPAEYQARLDNNDQHFVVPGHQGRDDVILEQNPEYLIVEERAQQKKSTLLF